jgi:hypothetical protein
MEKGRDGGGPQAGRGRPRPRCRVGVVHELVWPARPQASPPPAPPPRVARRCSYTSGSTTPRAPSPGSTHRTTFLSTSSAQKSPRETREWGGQSEREEERGGERRRAMRGLHWPLPGTSSCPPCRSLLTLRDAAALLLDALPLHRRSLTLHATAALLLDALPTAPPAVVSAQKAVEIDWRGRRWGQRGGGEERREGRGEIDGLYIFDQI